MRAAFVVAQILITFVVVAVSMPALLTYVPAMRNPVAGPSVALGLAVVVFTILRVIWPRRAR